MRNIVVQFWKNDGQGTLSGACDVSTRLSNLGEISWAIDDRFSKIEPGQLTCSVVDEDESVWNFLQTQIGSQVSGKTYLLQPWITITVDGTQKFLGLVDLASLSRDFASREITLSADDWFVLLRDLSLEGSAWQRWLPNVATIRPQAGPWMATREAQFAPDVLAFPPVSDVKSGDKVQTAGVDYEVLATLKSEWNVYVTLKGWSQSDAGSFSFIRLAATQGAAKGYTVTREFTKGNMTPFLELDTTDQLVPGDVLKAPDGKEFRVADVDCEAKGFVPSELPGETIPVGTLLTFTQETLEQQTYQDAGQVLRRACSPYRLELGRLVPPVAQRPVLAFLPTRTDAGLDLQGVSDLEPTLNGYRLLGGLGSTLVYTLVYGQPWAKGTLDRRNHEWTCQLAAAPSMLMPDQSEAVGITRRRNRSYTKQGWNRPVYVKVDGEINHTPDYAPSPYWWPDTVLTWDYTRFRSLVATNAAGAGSTLSEKRWSGSAWSAPTNVAWPVTGWFPASMVPMPGVAATTGPVSPQGQALLALAITEDATAMELQMVFAGSPVRLALSFTNHKGSELVRTPDAAYLISGSGYGKVRYTGGAIVLDWADLAAIGQTTQLLPQAFAALGDRSLYSMAYLQGKDADGKDAQTHVLVQLNPDPDPAHPELALVWHEQIGDAWPRLAMMFRDPTDSQRLVGLLGGRHFQVSATLPLTIERMRAEGMTAAELIEHIAQAMNAVVAARPDAVLEVISRNTLGTLTALTVDQAKVTQQRLSQYFFSVVRVSGAKDTLYADAFGPVLGGRALEFSSHPLIWTEGGCHAMAGSYAAFLGVPRRVEVHQWVFENANAAAPWEALPRWGRCTVNGGATQWLVTALRHSLVKGESTATLLEVV